MYIYMEIHETNCSSPFSFSLSCCCSNPNTRMMTEHTHTHTHTPLCVPTRELCTHAVSSAQAQ